MSKSDFILYIGDHGAALWHPRLLPAPLHAATPDDAHALTAALLAAPRCGVLLLADDGVQEIRHDNLPPGLGLFDRLRLARRRLAQHFPGAALAGRLTTRRTPRDILGFTPRWPRGAVSFAHLPESGPSFVWLRWLAALPNPQRGAVPSGGLLARLLCAMAGKDLAAWTHLFVALPGGLRQISLQGALPVLTRFIHLPEADGDMLGRAMLGAQRAAQAYLARHGWREDAEDQLVGILAPADLAAAQPHLPGALLLPPLEAAAWVRLAPATDGIGLLRAAARRYCLKPLTLAAHQAARQARWLMQASRAAALAALGSTLLLAGMRCYEVMQASEALTAQRAESARLTAAIAATAQDMSGDLALRTRMRHAQMLRAATSATTRLPFELWRAMGAALPPQIRLRGFDWSAAPGKGALTKLTLRVTPVAADKDDAQKEALQLYEDFAAALQNALPAAQLRRTQAPFALDPAHPFSDAAMLQEENLAKPLALLEIAEP